MRTLAITILVCLTLAFIGPGASEAIDLLSVRGQRVLLGGSPAVVSTVRLTQRQLKGFLDRATEEGWQLVETLSEDELILYQLEREERQVQLSYWVRQQMAVVLQKKKGKNYQQELLAMLSHPPGSLELSFATRGKEDVCLITCFKVKPGTLYSYHQRLERDGWQRWFDGQIELWERKGERLGLRRGESGLMVVWLLKKGGKEFAQI